jgi:GTPase SAR1 family protein
MSFSVASPHLKHFLLTPRTMPALTRPQELHVKVLVIGNSSVGKSSLLMRWSENQWLPEDEAIATIGVEVLVSYLIVSHRQRDGELIGRDANSRLMANT